MLVLLNTFAHFFRALPAEIAFKCALLNLESSVVFRVVLKLFINPRLCWTLWHFFNITFMISKALVKLAPLKALVQLAPSLFQDTRHSHMHSRFFNTKGASQTSSFKGTSQTSFFTFSGDMSYHSHFSEFTLFFTLLSLFSYNLHYTFFN